MSIKKKKSSTRIAKVRCGYNIHHRCCKAQGGSDRWPPNNTVRVSIYRHGLWNILFNGRDRIHVISERVEQIPQRLGHNVTVRYEMV